MLISSVLTVDPQKVDRDYAFLLECFQEVLEESGDADLARRLEWNNTSIDSVDGVSPERLAQAYSIAFQLLSMVEQNAGVQQRRSAEAEHGLARTPSLWGQVLSELKQHELTDLQISAALPQMKVELVMTAHPTEAKRATVLEHHRKLYLLLVQRENHMWTPSEEHAIREEIKLVLSLLWRTGEIFLEKPDVASERRNIIHYLRNVFPDVVPLLDARLRHAWEYHGLNLDLVRTLDHLPCLAFGTWVGGDRDGHPLVTADVTRETLSELRLHALLLLHQQLTELARQLSLSDRLQSPPPSLLTRIAEVAEELGDRGKQAVSRNAGEPWRQLINLMLARLPLEIVQAEQARLLQNGTSYRRAADLREDLQHLYTSLIEVGAQLIADYAVQPIMRSLQVFGFHFAVLDIRQNSRFHDLAMAQMLVAAGLEDTDFHQWNEAKRLAFLEHELVSPRPFARPDMWIGPEADAVLSCFRVLVEHIKLYGADGLGALIVSMTRSLSDLLVLYLFAREVGLNVSTLQGQACPLPVVPLFETIDDLQHSPDILRSFLEHPMTRRSLEYQCQQAGIDRPVQQVMIGYSDSNKDGGIFASLWNLYRAQANLVEIGHQHGVRVRFFHGRGGTISRGAGPTHRFVKAMPHRALGGDLRMTEQGETIAQKYANRVTAAYNLELLLAGVSRATLLDWYRPEPSHLLEPVMDRLAERSRQTYTDLLNVDGFVTFFRQATPIDVIEQSRIGSRPARRTGQHTFADLRAIPWVFSWGQARFFLSGWYGVGSTLEELQVQDPDAFAQVQQHLISWPPLHYVLSNAATSIMSTDPDVMQQYAALVEDADLHDRVFGMIMTEHERTRRMLELVYGGPLAERRPNVHGMMQVRQAGLRTLHRQQIALLRRWRVLQQQDQQDAATALLPHLLLTVNAIANGMGSTG